MPSLSTYVSDEIAPAITAAAAEVNDGKVAPWIAEAIRQRLEREGRLPGSARAKLVAQVVDLMAELEDDELARLAREAAAAAR